MQPIHLFCLTLLVALAPVSSQEISVPDRGCVSSFRNASDHYKICKTELCFVILPEKPYVIADLGSDSPPPHPFPCIDNGIYSGVFFEVLKRAGEMVPEVQRARCIYGGRNCSFDNSVRFIEDTVKLNRGYRFIAGGFFLFMPHRRTQHTIHSQPWSSEKMVVLFRHDGVKRSFEFAWRQVFQPYSSEGWGLLLAFMCLFCIALGIHTYRFSPTRSFRGLIRWFALSNPSARGVWETASWSTLRLAVVVFFAVSILLYEVSYLILQGPDNISNIKELRSLGLRNYAIVEGDSTETIFKYAVGWNNKTRKYPWVPVKTLDDAIKLIRDKTVKYGFSIETTVANRLRRDNLCDVISAIPTEKKDSGGWYYGISISRQLRQKIDTALATLVLEELPRKSKKEFGLSPLSCGRLTGELDYKVLLFILLLTVGPILLKHFASLILSRCWPDIEEPEAPTSPGPDMESELDPEEYIPKSPDTSTGSSQSSQISLVTKSNSSA